MKSAVVFVGVILIIVSLHASQLSEVLKLLGFKKESVDIFMFSMFLSLTGFLLFMAAYPRPAALPSIAALPAVSLPY